MRTRRHAAALGCAIRGRTCFHASGRWQSGRSGTFPGRFENFGCRHRWLSARLGARWARSNLAVPLHQGQVAAVAWNGGRIFSASEDGTVRILDLDESKWKARSRQIIGKR